MKNTANSVWLQKNPNVISDVKAHKIESIEKKINNKRGKKGIPCPKCPK